MQNPIVSVVMPCFNQGEFLAEAIESVLVQTFPSVEIILVEDYSTDGFTRDLVRKCVFPRTRTILNERNRGVVATRNMAVRAARGLYILPLDADDMIAPTFIERALEKLRDGTADVCYSRVMFCGTEQQEFVRPPFSLEGMLRGNMVVNTALYRKSAWAEVGGYSEAMSTGLEDWDFWLSLLECGNRFHRIDEPLFFYRRHGTSRTDHANKNEEHLKAILFARHKKLFRGCCVSVSRSRPLMFRKVRAQQFRKRLQRLTSSVFRRETTPAIPPKRPIVLHYFQTRGIANFGDRLNVTLLGALTGRPVRETGVTGATHLCIGSLLEGFLRRRGATTSDATPLQVWGAGFIAAPGEHPVLGNDAFQADGKEDFLRPVRVHAVRGRLTLERLRVMGLPVKGVALGDPGLLARLLVTPRTDRARPARGLRLGIVPHYVDAEEPILSELLCRFPLARLVRVSEPPLEFLRQLSACDIVLSSDMHGLIAADSLGIPNAWMRLSDRLSGDDWKFRDYYSVFGVEPAVLAIDDLGRLGDNDLRNLAATHPVTEAHVQEVVWNLLSTCPFLMPQEDAERRAIQPDVAASLRGLWYAKVASRFGFERSAA